METKPSIRKMIFRRRIKADPAELAKDSRVIHEKILKLQEFQDSKWMYTYMDFNCEVNTTELIKKAWALGKRVAVPKVVGSIMIFYEITSLDQLEPGYYQIPEPTCCTRAGVEDAFMVVPGVAFDRERNRIGYGQGYYDGYLNAHRQHKTAAVAFDFQIVDKIPREELDVRPHVLITPTETYR